MGGFAIKGGKCLNGEIEVSGSKNSVLPILSATVLLKGINVIKNCPEISDVLETLEILKTLGCNVEFSNGIAIIDSTNISNNKIESEFSEKMRSSIMFMGALLGRLNEAITGYPGGCEIGERPIDFHLKAFTKMGVEFEEFGGYIKAVRNKSKFAEINLDFPSVGATENIMILASVSEFDTIIYNSAKEPEIIDLQNFLNKAGAKIKGAGSDIIYIKGVKKLNPIEYTVLSDRIEAGTFMCAVAATGGKVFVKNAIGDDMRQTILRLSEIGCLIKEYNSGIFIQRKDLIRPINIIRTEPYPGFPTDMQAQIMSVLTLAQGTSIIIETVFESRFKHILELCKMGADISYDGRTAVVKGVKNLKGTFVNCKELRGGAALIIAGLVAYGETFIDNSIYIKRGYSNIEDKIKGIGGDISYKE